MDYKQQKQQQQEIQPLPKELHDFRAFLWLIWQHLNLPEPTPIQYDMAAYLQHGQRRKIIQGYRGVGKSWITSAYVVWRLRMNPQLNFLIVSASKVRADDFSTFTLRLIHDMPLLQCLRPSSDQRSSKIAFDVSVAEADHAASVKSVGITGQLAGSRADEIIADDVEVPNNSMTQPLRDKLSEAIKEFDAIIKPNGKITYLGTPQTEQSIYNILPQRGYMTRIYPARYPEGRLVDYYGDKLAPVISNALRKNKELAGRPTDPKRFGENDLLEREASYGRSGFALQFMLDTSISDSDKHPLKLRDLIVMSVDNDTAPEKVVWTNDMDKALNDLPCVGLIGDKYYGPMRYQGGDWLPYEASVMSIDPAGRGKDETSYAVGKMLHSCIYVTEAGGLMGGYNEETLEALVRTAKRNRVNMVLIESNFGDGMFKALIEPYFAREYPVTIEEVRHNVQKEKRIIDTLEPVMNQHRLIFDRRVIERDFESNSKDMSPELALRYQLMYQMSHITRDRGSLGHDDRLDALSMMVAKFTDMMNRDVDVVMERRRDEEMRRELAVFQGYAKGNIAGLPSGESLSIGKNTVNTLYNRRQYLKSGGGGVYYS